jgi:hypothetical protein
MGRSEAQAMTGVRLSVGAVRAGWYSIDNRGGNDADQVWDLECYPYPLPDSAANQIMVGHAINRINPARFGLIHFFNELWRLLVPNGELLIHAYYGVNARYLADPAACNPISEGVFYHLDPAHKSGLWQTYQPQPWEIKDLAWAVDGNIEVLLGKR